MRGGALAAVLILASPAVAGDWSGRVSAQWRGFTEGKPADGRSSSHPSAAASGEWRRDLSNGQAAAAVFGRFDREDSRRTHWDVREAAWIRSAETWELRLGVRRVFWGTAESRHLVDVINQTDLVEDMDEEEKLGQPMANLALIRDWGTVDLFVLPLFRERTFPAAGGRPRFSPTVDTAAAVYESGKTRSQASFAARFARSAGVVDFGVAHFSGAGREPTLLRSLDGASLIPRYELIEQTSIDAQATIDRWLFKAEALRRTGQGAPFHAFVGGFEFTLSRFLGAADLGFLSEYLYDERGRTMTPFDDDLMGGLRLGVNDAAGSQVLAAAVVDRVSGARFVRVEASRRVGRSVTVSLEARLFSGAEASDSTAAFSRDDHVQAELTLHF